MRRLTGRGNALRWLAAGPLCTRPLARLPGIAPPRRATLPGWRLSLCRWRYGRLLALPRRLDLWLLASSRRLCLRLLTLPRWLCLWLLTLPRWLCLWLLSLAALLFARSVPVSVLVGSHR